MKKIGTLIVKRELYSGFYKIRIGLTLLTILLIPYNILRYLNNKNLIIPGIDDAKIKN